MQHVHLKQWSVSSKVYGVTFNKILETGLYELGMSLLFRSLSESEMQYMQLRCPQVWYFEG